MNERYFLNAAQFAAAKERSLSSVLKSTALFDPKGVMKSFPQFKRDAADISDTINNTWLRTEYDTARRQAVQGEQFRQMQKDSDLYPYWQYNDTHDANECDECAALSGQVFRIGDPAGDAIYPAIHYNCGCSADPVDGDYLSSNNLEAVEGDAATELLNEHVDEGFRFNPAVQGVMPNEGSSFKVLPSANSAGGNMFQGEQSDNQKSRNTARLAAKGMHFMIQIISDWKEKYPTDKMGNIIFQNATTLANVLFTNNSLHRIQAHSAGFEQIPETIADPDEIWSWWEDPKEQRVVLRNYIIFDDYIFVVSTRDGIISDAVSAKPSQAGKFKNGVLI